MQPSGAGPQGSRPRHVILAGAIGALAVAAATGVILVIGAGDGDSDQHATQPTGASKEVAVGDLGPFDVVVSTDPAGAIDLGEVRTTLETSQAVERYAFLAFGYVSLPRFADLVQAGDLEGLVPDRCASVVAPGFAVALDDTAPDARDQIETETPLRVEDAGPLDQALRSLPPSRWDHADAEIFMDADASRGAIDAVAGELAADPDVAVVTHLTKDDAYEELLEILPDSTDDVAADDLPESFRIRVAKHADLDDVVARYTQWPGVDTVLGRPGPAEELAAVLSLFERPGPSDRAEIFMDVRADSEQVAAVRRALAVDPDIVDVDHLTEQDAYRHFQQMFAEHPELTGLVTPQILPESFRVRVAQGVAMEPVVDRYASMPGVDEVLGPGRSPDDAFCRA